MNNEIKYSCDNCLFYSNTGCKSNILCIRGNNYFPSDDPNISYQVVKIKKLKEGAKMVEYIKRENVMQTLQKANIGGYITERLLEIPSEDVQPVKRGAWKYYKNTGIFDIHKCSVCYTPFELPMDVVPSSVFCFCPHCGARMDGDEE